jgi:hypothetical protein
MKISQDVREFAKEQNSSLRGVTEAIQQKDEARSPRSPALARDDVERGMKEMAEKFKESGGEIYQKVG